MERDRRSSEWGTSAGGETLSFGSTFCQLGFPRCEHADSWRLLAVIFTVALSLLAGIAQLVEHNLAKVGVAGSSPVSRSRFFSGSVSLCPLAHRSPLGWRNR